MVIKTERLELKAIGPKDLPALAELLTDAVVAKTYMVPDFADRAEAEKLAKRLMTLSENPERYMMGIFLHNQLIGILHETQISGDTVEVGYALLPRFYGQGYATEALTGAIDGFFALGFRCVLAGAFEENAASMRVMQKSGMTKIDRQDVVTYRGKDHRCVYYAVSR